MTRYLEPTLIICGTAMVIFALIWGLSGNIDKSTNCIAWAACNFAMVAGLRK